MPILSHASGTDARGAILTDVAGDQFNAYEMHIYRDGQQDLHTLLNPADDAGYNRTDRNGPVSRCHTGTREDVIARVVEWVERDKTKILWINGPAGSGKSAIAQAVAERYAEEQRLAASFFFLRGAGNRSKFTRFIPSLAYQLSVNVPPSEPFIERAYRKEPTIMTDHSLSYQFRKLFAEPFLASKYAVFAFLSKPSIVVIDALDECDDKDLMIGFIDALTESFRQHPRLNLRVIVTSRVEEHIRKKLDTPAARLATYRLSLQDFDARLDIHKFLEASFSTIYEQNRRVMTEVSPPWPSETDLDALVKKCDGSFIFAVTIIKFIDDGDDLPHRKVQLALNMDKGLDPLYAQVLSAASRNGNFQRVMGTIVLLVRPLPIIALAELLHLRATDILQALLGVQSIIKIPGDDDEAVQLFHTSLRDYLCLQSRSLGFFIDPSTRHFSIVEDCLAVIKDEPKNGILYTEQAQQYACLQWWNHLQLGLEEAGATPDIPNSLLDCIIQFASGSLDCWVSTVLWKIYRDDILSSLQILSHYQGNLGMVIGRLKQHVEV